MTEEDVKQVQTLGSAERISSGALKPVSSEKISPAAVAKAAAADTLTPPPIKKASSDIEEEKSDKQDGGNLLQTLFANGNKVLTAEDGDLT